jgi:hypothetical protein
MWQLGSVARVREIDWLTHTAHLAWAVDGCCTLWSPGWSRPGLSNWMPQWDDLQGCHTCKSHACRHWCRLPAKKQGLGQSCVFVHSMFSAT